MKISVFSIVNLVRFNPAFSATETSKNIEIWHVASYAIINTFQRANDKCADQTAYMHRLIWALFLHAAKSGAFPNEAH